MLWLLFIPDNGEEEPAAAQEQEAVVEEEEGLGGGGGDVVGVYDQGHQESGEGYWIIQPDDLRSLYPDDYGIGSSSEDLIHNGGLRGSGDVYGTV